MAAGIKTLSQYNLLLLWLKAFILHTISDKLTKNVNELTTH